LAELDAVECPVLVVRGGDSEYSREDLQEAARRLRSGRYTELPGAGHVLHYDNPAGWRCVVEPFVAEVTRSA
jgi:pimeloyl-ACP methyl ester carboxylesterase